MVVGLKLVAKVSRDSSSQESSMTLAVVVSPKEKAKRLDLQGFGY